MGEPGSSLTVDAADPTVAAAEVFTALEVSDGPLTAQMLPGLGDPAVRSEVSRMAAAAGRKLVPVAGGWVTGFDDEVADVLTAAGVGLLDVEDRAVLALVLLRSVAAPRARGDVPEGSWATGVGVTVEDLAANRHLPKRRIQRSLRRLRAAGIVAQSPRGGITPGPQLWRLTDLRSEWVWASMLAAAQPDSPAADAVRRRYTPGPVTIDHIADPARPADRPARDDPPGDSDDR